MNNPASETAVDGDYEWLGRCNFEADYQGNDGQMADCGELAVAKVWFEDKIDAAWYACPTHLAMVFPNVPKLREVAALEEALAKAERERDKAERDTIETSKKAHEFFKRAEEAESNAAKQKALADRLAAALRNIATPTTRRTDDNSTICLRCGMETFHEKDGEVIHEKDCVQQYAVQALKAAWEAENG